MKKVTVSIVASIMAVIVSACQLTNPVFTITCTEFNLIADSATATVDNTGTDTQNTYVRGYDGYGNQLFNVLEDSSVGPTITDIDETYTYNIAPLANPITIEFFSPAGGSLPTDTIWYEETGSCVGLPDASVSPIIQTFLDGRINNRDSAAPFAVYQEGEALHIYAVDDTSQGAIALVVTLAELEAGEMYPEENTVIASNQDLGIYVLRLRNGKLQIQGTMQNGKTFIMIFDDIYSIHYESYELDE